MTDTDREWEPTRWWRAIGPDDRYPWIESSDENEVREEARPGDQIQRLYSEVPRREWRTEHA